MSLALPQEPDLARAGRKRKNFDARMRKGVGSRESKIDRGTPELIRKRGLLVPKGFEHDQRASDRDPLGVLCLNGLITDDQRQAGIEFGRIHWRMFGQPFAPCGSYNDDIRRSDGGTGPNPSEETVKRYNRADKYLKMAGRRSRHHVRKAACELRYPVWFIRRKNGIPAMRKDNIARQDLVRGLRVLARNLSAWRLTDDS